MFPQIQVMNAGPAVKSVPTSGSSGSNHWLSSLFCSMKLSDVTVLTKTDEFPAHKIILSGNYYVHKHKIIFNKNYRFAKYFKLTFRCCWAAQSEFFEKMFKHPFKENTENQVNLKEYNADLIKELLRWMYLEEVENLTTFASQLLPLADLVSTLLIIT